MKESGDNIHIQHMAIFQAQNQKITGFESTVSTLLK